MISMNERLDLAKNAVGWCNKNQPLTEGNEMTPSVLSAVISQLKEQPAAQFPERFKNRWK